MPADFLSRFRRDKPARQIAAAGQISRVRFGLAFSNDCGLLVAPKSDEGGWTLDFRFPSPTVDFPAGSTLELETWNSCRAVV